MKCAVVFGASGTIGRALAAALHGCGYAVAMQYHSRCPDIDGLPSAMPSLCLKGDIRDSASVADVFRQARVRLGTPCIVVNAAGIALKQQLLQDTADEEIERILSVNLAGALYISREAAKALHTAGGGLLLHISSMWGICGASCEAVYAASKGGMNALVKSLAKELAPDNIRVNAIAPGLVPSPMNAALSPQDMEAFIADTPLGCSVSPEDIAEAMLYLIRSPHVTGQILSVDGGIVI